MRVSTSGMFQRALADMQRQTADIARTQEQISSGQRINRAGEDPPAAARGVALDAALAEITRFGNNIGRVRDRLVVEESALAQMGDVFNTVKSLTVQAGSGAHDVSSASALARQLRSQADQLLALANQRDADGGAIFAGTVVTEQAFSVSGGALTYHGNANNRAVTVGPAQQLADGDHGQALIMDVPAGPRVTPAAANTGAAQPTAVALDPANPPAWPVTLDFAAGQWTATDGNGNATALGPHADGQALHIGGLSVTLSGQPADGDQLQVATPLDRDLHSRITAIADALEAYQPTEAGRAALGTAVFNGLGEIDGAIDHVLDTRASVGTRLSSLDRSQAAHESLAVDLMGTLADLRDTDVAEAASRLSLQITALQAAQQMLLRTQNLSLFRLLGS